MNERAGVRFNPGDYYFLEVDTDAVTCEVDGTIDGVPVTFFGNSEAGRIIGSSVAWNQLCNHGNFDVSTGWAPTRGTGSVSSNVYSYTYTELNTQSVSANRTERHDINIPATHKVFIAASVKCAHIVPTIALILGEGLGSQIEIPILSTNWTNVSAIFNTVGGGATRCGIGFNCTAEFTVNDVTQLKDFNVIDLTQMFGSTIADYIYALETDTPGAGVDLFKTLFAPDDYYAYDAGSPMKIAIIPRS